MKRFPSIFISLLLLALSACGKGPGSDDGRLGGDNYDGKLQAALARNGETPGVAPGAGQSAHSNGAESQASFEEIWLVLPRCGTATVDVQSTPHRSNLETRAELLVRCGIRTEWNRFEATLTLDSGEALPISVWQWPWMLAEDGEFLLKLRVSSRGDLSLRTHEGIVYSFTRSRLSRPSR